MLLSPRYSRPANAAGTATVAVSVSSSPDDARSTDAPAFTATETTAQVGAGYQRPNVNGYRFSALAIPPGAIIDSVVFSLVKQGDQWQQFQVDLAFEATDSAAAFSSAAAPAGRPRTTAHTLVGDNLRRTEGTRYSVGSGPGLAAALQEVVGRPGWRSGNAVALIAYGAASAGYARLGFYTVDGGAARAPRLEVSYHTPDATGTPTPTATASPTSTASSTIAPTATPARTATATRTASATSIATTIPTPTATAGGPTNGALAFDGLDDEARGGLLTGTAGSQTIECWFRPSVARQSTLLLVNSDDVLGWIVELYQGQFRFWMADAGGTWRAVTQWNTFLAAGAWYHLAVTYDASSGVAQLFLNGAPGASAALGRLSQGPYFRLGGLAPYPYAAGQLDELRISRAIRYTGAFSAPSTAFAPDASTIALYHFDEGSGQQLIDASGNGNTLILGTSSGVDGADPVRVASTAPTGGGAAP